MAHDNSPLKSQIPNQGWKQFLIARDEMLSAYDNAKEHSNKRQVKTGHGNVAESAFRRWLTKFLPKRYGVTAGYIISPGVPNAANFIHYDVIIYDQLESPVLWIENNADSSELGRSMAIPVEYVHGVIEVKSAFNKKAVKKAVEQLTKLKPLLACTEPANHPMKLYLPPNFFFATVFYELRKKDEMDFAALDELVEAAAMRGFYGGYILRGETIEKYYSGKLILLRESHERVRDNQSLLFYAHSKSYKVADGTFRKIQLDYAESYFSEFAFDIIALLKGTYNPNVLSSMYGMGSTQWENGSAVDIRYFKPEDVKKFDEETAKFFRK
ncbi:DUF6602 domain-containing protein [uncultured Sphingobacterium sp.]|uniref:DUF6602 domain-containing protein n=1 Tax=uncultured Sphingobacterium sp. TaxID=182688 RepID=UPI003749BD50